MGQIRLTRLPTTLRIFLPTPLYSNHRVLQRLALIFHPWRLCLPVRGGLPTKLGSPTSLPATTFAPPESSILCSKSTSSLSCFYCNAQSIKNEISDLHDLLYSYEYEIIVLTETWLVPDLSDGILDPRGHFNVFRNDRWDRVGGGVCIFVLMTTGIDSNVLHFDKFFQMWN